MNNKKDKVRETLKLIPSIDEILKKNKISDKNTPIDFIKYNLNEKLNEIRETLLKGNLIDNPKKYIDDQILKVCNETFQKSLRPVINGTGIILHTGLGRAPISKEILIEGITQNYPYSNLEINIRNGKRGDRNTHISKLISSICNSEDSIVVNNNAAAVMLTLNSLCDNKEVIISRGQQVEIGGSFRIPDVIEKSNCNMIEVGTTNKTHIEDYKNAINSMTGAILYVHTSNYKVIGFTSEVDINQLSKLSSKYQVPLIVDLGSGSITDFKSFGLPMEKMIKKYIEFGADIITFSGDKLLGGPQSGIISGQNNLIKIIKKNSIYRAVRCDKIRISILENILRTYYSSKNVSDKNLAIQLFLRSQITLESNAKKILKGLSKKIIKDFNICYQTSYVEAGSGSLPTEKMESIAICLQSKKISSTTIYRKFLNMDIPLVGYINNDIFYIDLKAIPNDQLELVIESINQIV
jgi:L-seryl-tRNA(Ser) seleniumtransferase